MSLDAQKDEVKELVTAMLEKEEAEPPPKKAKTAAAVKAGNARPSVKKDQMSLMTRTDFSKAATTLDCKIGDYKLEVPPKNFSTGSCGWFCSKKDKVTVGGVEAIATYQVMITVVGSKEWEGQWKE